MDTIYKWYIINDTYIKIYKNRKKKPSFLGEGWSKGTTLRGVRVVLKKRASSVSAKNICKNTVCFRVRIDVIFFTFFY
jgi:hypothetical protein